MAIKSVEIKVHVNSLNESFDCYRSNKKNSIGNTIISKINYDLTLSMKRKPFLLFKYQDYHRKNIFHIEITSSLVSGNRSM